MTPFLVAEEIYGFDTLLYGIRARNQCSHVFRVDEDKTEVEIQSKMHRS